MKILALDLGDVYTGTAISDSLGIIAIPLKTVQTNDLEDFLKKAIEKENIKTILIGYPKTMKGTISIQTQKIIDFEKAYKIKFPEINWVFWDERLTSKRAESFKKSKEKDDKLRLHSVAAALILETYLQYLQNKRLEEEI